MDPLDLLGDDDDDDDDDDEEEEEVKEPEPKKMKLDFKALEKAGYENKASFADSESYKREADRKAAEDAAAAKAAEPVRDEAVDHALQVITEHEEAFKASLNVDRAAMKGKMRQAGDGRGMFSGTADKDVKNSRFKTGEGKKRQGGQSHHSEKEDEKRIRKQMGQGGLGFD